MEWIRKAESIEDHKIQDTFNYDEGAITDLVNLHPIGIQGRRFDVIQLQSDND